MAAATQISVCFASLEATFKVAVGAKIIFCARKHEFSLAANSGTSLIPLYLPRGV